MTALRQQRGSALFICLMILVILSLLGISALRMTLGQNMIAMNAHAGKLAFQAAESAASQAIRQAELGAELVNRNILPVNPGTSITLPAVQDPNGVTRATVTVTKLDPQADEALQERNLLMQARLGGMGNLKVESESFAFSSRGEVQAVGTDATTVQETYYSHLTL